MRKPVEINLSYTANPYHLKGQKDGEGRDYKVVLEKDWQDLEAAGVVLKGVFDAARKWLAGAW